MSKEYQAYLAHHGIKGQKWGVRRFQNEDGTLTKDGKKRYLSDSNDHISRFEQSIKNNREDAKKFKEDQDMLTLLNLENQSLRFGIKYEKATSEFINKQKNVKLSDVQNYIREWGKQNKINPDDIDYMVTTHEPLKWKKIVEGK